MLALVTALANSIEVKQGTPVAEIRVYASNSPIIERTLRAGIDTSEWAHERPDVRVIIQHALAHVFDTRPGEGGVTFPAHRYLARVPLDTRARLDKVEITNLTGGAALTLSAASLYDSASQSSTPLSLISGERWDTVYQKEQALVLRNKRAQPRTWLVAEAEAVNGEEALRRIRGQSDKSFDPRRTALMEVAPEELPVLAGGELPPESTARVVAYEPSRLTIETDAKVATVLVVSEMNYPGWEATIDGERARIVATDFLLRGVALEAGAHRIEMRYTAPAARNGAIISILSLLSLVALGLYSRQRRKALPHNPLLPHKCLRLPQKS